MSSCFLFEIANLNVEERKFVSTNNIPSFASRFVEFFGWRFPLFKERESASLNSKGVSFLFCPFVLDERGRKRSTEMKIYRDGESMKKRRGVLKEWHMDVPRNNSSLLIFFARTKHSFELVNLSPSSIRARMEINAKEGITPPPPIVYFFDTTFASFFFLFFFFISPKRNEYTRYIYEIVLDRKKCPSKNRNTWTTARHAAIFSSSLIIFISTRDTEREREMCHPTFRATKRRTEERNRDEKVWQEFKNQLLRVHVHDRLAPPFFPNFSSTRNLLWLSSWKHAFFISIPLARNRVESIKMSSRAIPLAKFFSPGIVLDGCFLQNTFTLEDF